MVQLSQVVPRLQVTRLQVQRPLQGDLSLVETAEVLERERQIVPPLGQQGFQGQGAPVACYRLGAPPQGPEAVPHVVVRGAEIPPEGKCLCIARHRLLVPPGAVLRAAEIIEEFGVLGAQGQRPLEFAGRLGEATLPTQGDAPAALRLAAPLERPGGCGGERLTYRKYHVLPPPGCLLPEQPQGRVPGGILPLQEPAPVRNEREHDPDREAKPSTEVRDRGIHRQHQVELRRQGCCIGEIIYFTGEVGKPESLGPGRFRRGLAQLQGVEAHPRDSRQGLQPLRRNGAVGVVLVPPAAAPDHSDPEGAVLRDQRTRLGKERRVALQIGYPGRQGTEHGPEKGGELQ